MPTEDFFRNIVENMHDGVYFVDRRRRITFWNKGAERITGYCAAEVVGKSCADNILVHVDSLGRQLCQSSCPLVAAMGDGTPQEAEVFLHHKQGHRLPVWVRISPLRGEDGSFIGAVELFTDISTRHVVQEQVEELKKLALIDSLTGLPNRRHFEAQLHSRLEEWRRNRLVFGLLFIDIDHFKQFNDRYGHDVGDQVLAVIGNTLALAIRPFDVLCRWGGEEFAGIFPHADLAALDGIGHRLRTLVAHSKVSTGSAELFVTVSIGGTISAPEDSVASILKRADTLMYASKTSGRNQVTIG
jgi:diguanylate cyclase (GGDEF)-like protein/PAS domain S-box-containing protein